jgi:hypothetical protein
MLKRRPAILSSFTRDLTDMSIKFDTFKTTSGSGTTPNLDAVTTEGASTTNSITVGGVTIGTEYSLPSADGGSNQYLKTDGAGNLSFSAIDVTGGLEYKGAFNAIAGTPSLLNAEKGDFYVIDTAGTIYGKTWAVGDHLLINENMGGTITNSKIDKIDNTDTPASETVAGVIEIATNAEATAGTATDKALVPSNLSSIALSTLNDDLSYLVPSNNLSDLDSASTARTNLGLGTSATLDVGTTANLVVQLDASARLPAVDGSQLTNLPSASPASETVAGIIEIATNAEATAGTATDKALVPSNISSFDLSVMDNTTSTFITVDDIPTASHSTAGILETATNAEASAASANDKILTPANLSHIDLSTLNDDLSYLVPSNNLSDLDSASTARTNLGLGTSATLDVGTTANLVVQLDASARLPAVDGSQLTNLPSASPASETVAGIIEIATNAEATAGTATDKALVPSNLGSIALSTLNDDLSYLVPSNNLSDLASASTARTNLGLGTSATIDVGTTANLVVQLDGSARLPAVDGSQLTNLPSGGGFTYSAITADPANAEADYHYSCTGTFTITLPTTGIAGGKEIRVKNMGTGTITIDPQTSNIDGSTTDYVLDVQYSAITLVADGSNNWEVI